MSGSGGGGGGGGWDDVVSCDRLFINTQLSSPRPGVISQLAIGLELDVGIELLNGMQVVVATWRGEVAGGLTSPESARLRQCIEQGTSYSASVVDITGGQVRVRVHPA